LTSDPAAAHEQDVALFGDRKDEGGERPTATVAEVYLIAENVRPWFRALVLMAGFTGLRWGELMALTRREVDLKAATVKVVAAVIELDKLSLGPPKSRAGQRTVALPRQLVDELQRHLDKHAERGPRGRVFVGPTGVTPRRTKLNREWHRATKAAGVEGLRLHDLRHTANALAAPGSSTKALMRRMGHASTPGGADLPARRPGQRAGDRCEPVRHDQGDAGRLERAARTGTQRARRPPATTWAWTRSRCRTPDDLLRSVWHPQRDSNPCRHLERVVS
jgi:integrase